MTYTSYSNRYDSPFRTAFQDPYANDRSGKRHDDALRRPLSATRTEEADQLRTRVEILEKKQESLETSFKMYAICLGTIVLAAVAYQNRETIQNLYTNAPSFDQVKQSAQAGWERFLSLFQKTASNP